MGKKVTQDSIGIIFQDPNYIPEPCLLPREQSPYISILERKSYPDDYPNACIQNGTSFFSINKKYAIDVHNNIYFKDPDTGEVVYLNKIDTTSYTHKMYAEFIYNDLNHYTNEVKLPGTDRDTTVYAGGGVRLYHTDPRVKAHTFTEKKGPGPSTIEFNMNFKNGLPANLYEIQSLCRHEAMHIRDFAIAKAKNKKYEKISDLSHAEDIYKVQMTYKEFREAPPEFKQGVIRTYADFVIKGCREKEIRTADEVQHSYFDNFNRDVGEKIGASIKRRNGTKYGFDCEMKGHIFFSIDLWKDKEK